MANFYDLNPQQQQSSDGSYFDIVLTGFVPDTDYGLVFAWDYEDPELPDSPYSDVFNFKTIQEPELLPPHFISDNLYAINSTVYIEWDGTANNGLPYIDGKIKQINIWIKGGDFGETYVRYATPFTKAGIVQLNATQKVTYCVKLQAESTSGKTSEFSDEFCVTLLKQPKAPSDVRHEWDAAGNLTVYWKFDPTFKDTTNDNTLADSFGLQLLDSINDNDATWWTAVEKDKIPPLEQKIIISANQLQKVFGQYTAYEINYDAFIYTRDKNLQTSFVTGYALTKYSDPLTAPTITATTAPMAYQVAYTANAAFDQIYVEESLNGTTWTLVAVSPANPVLISTLNTSQRSVRARFSKKLGGFTGYSNTVTVTPTKIDPTDTTPPSVPSVTAGTTTYNTIPITITTSDDTTKGFRVRYKLSTESLYTTDIVIYSGASTSYTIKNLTPSKTYNISVAAYDGANNLSDYSTTVNASTGSTTVPVVSNITLSALSYGLYASWTAPSSPTVAIDNYKVELYNSSNTLLQTVYSFTTVTSFTGLKASTTYYVKVNAIDITGNSGTQVTSSNLTLNAAGGISDGSAPSSSPTPTVTALYQALEVKWTAISNIDLVTYEVHISSTSGFTPSSSTKALETQGTFAVIKTLPGTSTSLTYGTTYYVKIIAKDFDGSAAASTQASAQTLQVDNGDLAANSVRANVIQAGTITGDKMVTDTLFANQTINVGQSTSANKITLSGVTIAQNTLGYSNPTSPIYGRIFIGSGLYSDSNTSVYLDNLGRFSLKDKLLFDGSALTVNGTINASAGNITGALTLNSGAMKIGANVNSTFDGIYINTNNYWYSNGNFKVGGASNNATWDGTSFTITGAINATSGTITGNLNVTTGSVIAGSASGARVTMSSTGIFAYDGSATPVLTTSIIANAAAGGNTFTTTKALIGNWTVTTDKITGGGLSLNSSGSIVGTSGGSYIGIKPRQTAGTDIVLWSGNTETPAINSAASGQAGFQVNADGQLYATGAIISGKLTLESGSSLGGLLADTSKVYYSGSTPTAPTGGFKTGDSWVDTSNNNQLKIWNGTSWVVAQDSEAAKSIANTKTKTTYGATQPSSPIAGDVWFDTNTGIGYFKVYNGTAWVRMKDSDITAAQLAAQNALDTANTKAQTTYGYSAPVNPKSGDIWFDTNFNYFKRYNGTSWDRMKDADITAAQNDAALAAQNAGTALSKAAKFGVDGSLISNLIIENSGAAIYSKYVSGGVTIAKDSYASSNAGFYMGWDSQAGVLYPAFNIGNANAYVKWSNYNTTLEIKGNIVNGGDYWNADGSFRLGGVSGITKGTTGKITLGSDTIIQGSVTATSLDTTNTDIDTSGNITIVNGTKTTTISNNASISMTDSSTGWDTGGAITINAIRNIGAGGYGNENVSAIFGANQIQLSRSGGSPSASYQSYIAHADELSSVSRGTLLISTGGSAGIALKPGLSSSQVQILGRLNPVFGIVSTYIQGATTWNSTAIRNITVSSSAPSGGSEGDVWIQI